MDGDADDPLSRREVEAAVRAVEPEFRVADVTWCEDGSDVLYFVTVETADGRRDLVLKLCSYTDPEEFRVEPHLLDVLTERTSIPVPAMVGTVDDHPDLPTPFFLMERCEGEHVTGDELDLDAVGRVAREAGRNLGELHALGSFDRYGFLRCQRDDPDVRPGIDADGYTLGVGDPIDSWREWLLAEVEPMYGDVDDPFDDLVPDLRSFVESNADLLDSDGPTVLADVDYWYGNVLLDPGTGETRAVIDFGKMHTATAEYNLAITEQFLARFAPLDSDRRRRVREQLYAGYEETNALDRGDRFEERRAYYLALTWLGPLTLFDDWYGPQYDGDPDELATRYRTALSELL
jgi:aminoglycoside phosphotransferase (APT) family kinase protein